MRAAPGRSRKGRRAIQQRLVERYCEIAKQTEVNSQNLLAALDLLLRSSRFEVLVLNTTTDLYKLPRASAKAALKFLDAYQ